MSNARSYQQLLVQCDDKSSLLVAQAVVFRKEGEETEKSTLCPGNYLKEEHTKTYREKIHDDP